ncbi:MAG TPA: RDD family protein, partial [Phenylobacterium sp.]
PADTAREFVTPEGVDLRLRIGEAGERAAAFVIDCIILIIALVVVSIISAGVVAASQLRGLETAAIVWLLIAFFLRNFYFMAFELRPGAATPGKRMLGLRVIARGGGRLTADAVFARNAMRELEVFLPMSFLFSRGFGVDAWLILLGLLWSGLFLFFPLFNRDRLRVGDLVAGTMVVKAARRKLAPDLVDERTPGVGRLAFAQAQVDAYGVKELHVLEEVLRRQDRPTMRAVAQRIQVKIGWEGEPVADGQFLAAYYAALRARLEGRLLFGHRRKDKFDKI